MMAAGDEEICAPGVHPMARYGRLPNGPNVQIKGIPSRPGGTS